MSKAKEVDFLEKKRLYFKCFYEEWATPTLLFYGGQVSPLLVRINQIAAEVAADLGFDIIKTSLSGTGRKSLLRIYIDKEGGVTIGDCESFSRRLETLLDVEDIIQNSYVLEVSSPGMDRPIRDMKDFEGCIGKLVRIITKEKIENQTFFIGRLTETGTDWIRLLLEDRKIPKHLFIPFEVISKARLEIEIKQEP